MRRLRERSPPSFFRGAELPRLLTLLVMLGVLWLLIDRARDPRTWRWIAADDAGGGATVAAPPGENAGAARPAAPIDLDPDEREAAAEELAAVADRIPLGREEMPAYWRLFGWARGRSAEDLARGAATNVTFRDLWHEPERYRGRLLSIRLHLRRTVRVDHVADNPLGVTTLYEVWGWNNESQPFSFWLVVPELPPGMPGGSEIYEEATFSGYFLKLLPFEDGQGKARAAPLLVGRLAWHPMPSSAAARRDEWKWTGYIAAALLALAAARWIVAIWQRRRRRRGPLPGDDAAVEAWLNADPSAPSEQSAAERGGVEWDADRDASN